MKNRNQPTAYQQYIEQFQPNSKQVSQISMKTKKKIIRRNNDDKESKVTYEQSDHYLSTNQNNHYKSKNQHLSPFQSHSTSTCDVIKTSYSNEKKYNGLQDSSNKNSSRNYNKGQSRLYTQSNQEQLILLSNRFRTEFTNCMSNIKKNIKNQQSILQMKISYIQYLQLLKEMCMIYSSYEPIHDDIIMQLWNQFIAGKTVNNLMCVLSLILRITQLQHKQTNQYMVKKYQSIRFTRLELDKSHTSRQISNKYTYHPNISHRSRQIILSKSKSKGKTVRIKYHLKCTKNQQNKQQKQINDKNNQNILKNTLGNRRSEILYQQGRQKSVQKNNNKKTIDVEYERNYSQLTFQPKIKGKQNINKKIKKIPIRGESTTINRMIRGRIQRQIKQIINRKGITYNDNLLDKMRKQKYQHEKQKSKQNYQICQFSQEQKQKIDILLLDSEEFNSLQTKKKKQENTSDILGESGITILDIYIEKDKCQKLILHQNESLQIAASRFIKQNNLNENVYDKLVKELQIALRFQLHQIQQDQLQQEYDQFI